MTNALQDLEDRIHGGLAGAVIGDALGAITETLSINQIRHLYGWLDDFTQLRHQPYGQDRVLGAYTDDASLVIAMANAIVESGGADLESVVRHLIRWSEDPKLAQFAGPSTKRAVARIASGEEARLVGMGDVQSFTGVSNGGAMKAAPAGWLHPGDITAAAEAAAVICTPTHNTQIGISGAAAIAAACSQACVSGASLDDVLDAAVHGARIGEQIGLTSGREVAGSSVGVRLDEALKIARSGAPLEQIITDLAERVGAGLNTYESVPAALGLVVACGGDVNLTAIAAANIGDDTDTIGSMAAAVSGTYSGISQVKPDWYDLVCQVNDLRLDTLAWGLAQASQSA